MQKNTIIQKTGIVTTFAPLSKIAFVLLMFCMISLVLTSLTIESLPSNGANQSSDSTVVFMNITNTEPIVYDVQFNVTTVVLTPGNKTTVNCTAWIWDYNNFNDLKIVNATFYDASVSNNNQSDDLNYHYTNSTCNLNSSLGGSTTNGTFTCLFNVDYFANNGTWICNVTASDQSNITSNRNRSIYVESLLGIEVPPSVNFGNVTVNSYAEQNISVTNIGNMDINVSVYGYGGTSSAAAGNLTSFICQLGNISSHNFRFSSNASANFTNKVHINTTPQQIFDFKLPQRINDTARVHDQNTTFWEVYIPNSIGGYCNGTLVFGAVDRELA